jgi:hypothetical protein
MPSTTFIPPTPIAVKWRDHATMLVYGPIIVNCYNRSMTLLEIRYALASPLTLEQLNHLGEFSNTYGLRKFRLNEAKTELSFEYDASRLRETQVQHVLGQAKIAVAKKLN